MLSVNIATSTDVTTVEKKSNARGRVEGFKV